MKNPTLAQAIEFTNVYKQHKNSPVAIREAMCFKAQYPALLPTFRDDQMYVGRRSSRRIVYVGSVWWFGMPGYSPSYRVESKQGGYCFDFSAPYSNLATNDEEKAVLQELYDFWMNESTSGKVYNATSAREGVGFLFANNLERLISRGLPGLVEDVQKMTDCDLKTGFLLVLEGIADVLRYYKKDAEERGRTDIAENMQALISHAPKTLAQALQLILIYEMLSHEQHYEINAIDIALGDLLAENIDSGMLSEEDAVHQIHQFFKMIRENGETAVCRFMMGGKNRRNTANADRFIKVALLAEQRHREVIPQVSIKIYDGFSPELLELAYDTISITGTFPTLFNDDVLPQGTAEAFDISLEEANNYYPLGCGEVILAHQSPALLTCSWDIPRTIDIAMREFTGTTFDELYTAVQTQMAKEADYLAEYHKLLFDMNNADCAFLMGSLLTDDCIGRGKPIMGGGPLYTGACVMGHGFTNAADALIAIKKLVFDEKTYTLEEIIKACDANFEGHTDLRKALLDAPKYGNDHADADKMLNRVWRDLSDAGKVAAKNHGMDFLTVSSVNPGGYHLGAAMGATADGRLAHIPYAIGNAPSAGSDKNGITALMNSVLRTDPANGGTMTNFKVSREFFVTERDKFRALFNAYFADGGIQANITIVNRGDLEAALKEPEKFPHLMVRLGGWTQRFIDLEPHIQKEILTRTLY